MSLVPLSIDFQFVLFLNCEAEYLPRFFLCIRDGVNELLPTRCVLQLQPIRIAISLEFLPISFRDMTYPVTDPRCSPRLK